MDYDLFLEKENTCAAGFLARGKESWKGQECEIR